jgi:membrane protease YdiL (CAAX protease family)
MINTHWKAGHAVLKAVLFSVAFTALFALLSFFKSFLPLRFERFTHGIIGTLAALTTIYAFVRLEGKSFRHLGLQADRSTWRRLLIGVIAGLATSALMFGSLLVFGRLRLEVQHPQELPSFLFWTLAFLSLAFMEEVAFRGYALAVLKHRIGVWPALLVSTILFAVYHIANGWSVAQSLLGPGVWGLVFGFAALTSNGIAMPTGIHYAVNVSQAALGMTSGFAPLWTFQLQDRAVSAQSTQALGICIQVVLLLVTVFCIEWYRRRKRVVDFRRA